MLDNIREELEELRKENKKLTEELKVYRSKEFSFEKKEDKYKSLLKNETIEMFYSTLKGEFPKEQKSGITWKTYNLILKDINREWFNFADIIDIKALQELINDFHALTKLSIGITDINGKILAAAGWQDICTKFHRMNPESCRNCIESDAIVSKGLKKGEFKIYKCKNNMWDVATPIIVDGKHIANIFTGQFFFESEKPDFEVFRKQAGNYGFNEKEYLAALEKVPVLSREKVNLIMNFYKRLANIISILSYSNIILAKSLIDNKQKEDILKKSEESFRSYIENAPDSIFLADENGNYILVNNAAILMTGFSKKELLRKHIFDIIFHEDLHKAKKHFKTVVEHGTASGEMRFVTKAGEVRYCMAKAVKIRENNFLFFKSDITKLKNIEKNLLESEYKFQSLAENSIECIIRYDREYRYTYMNPAALKISGYKEAQVIGKTIRECDLNKDMYSMYEENISRVFTTGQIVRSEHKLKGIKGSFWLDWIIIPEFNDKGDVWSVMAIARDITERKKMEETLKETKNRLQVAIDAGKLGIWELDIQSNALIWDDRMLEIYGIDRSSFSKDFETWEKRLHPDDAEDAKKRSDSILSRNIDYDTEFRIITPDGTVKYIKANGIFIRDKNGNPIKMIGTNHDITKEKLMEISLREKQEALKKAQRISRTGSWHYDIKTDINKWSDEMFVIFGLKQDSGLLPWDEYRTYIHPDDLESVNNAVIMLSRNGTPYNMEFRILNKDGKLSWVKSIGEAIFDISGEIIALNGTVQDITGQKKLEIEKNKLQEKLIQSQKMEAIGLLAGGIAHDFNNIIGSLMGYTELSLYYVKDIMIREYLEQVLKGCNRAKNLTSQILTISRKHQTEKKIIKISLIIKEVVSLVKVTIPSTIKIIENIEAPKSLVFGDPIQIYQILINLITNSYQAMKGQKGIIEIKLSNVYINDMETGGGVLPGSYVKITVKDNGTGMDKNVLRHIFEPYFTTKEIGEGTGLGLSVVHSIVKSHNGHIKVYSEPGEGTFFNIFLPENKTDILEKNSDMETLPTGTESILIVDDEETLVMVTGLGLEKLGYKCACLADSSKAFEVFRKAPQQFDLIITDKTMPLMTGIDLAKECTKIRTDIPVILCTGFEEERNSEFLNFSFIKKILKKPFTQEILSQTIREVLDNK